MHKKSSFSSGSSKPGGKGSFKKNDDAKPFNRNKKNFTYEGQNEDSGSRSSRPGSGSAADGDRPKRPYGKTSGTDSRSGDRDNSGRPPRKEFGGPKRSFESGGTERRNDGDERSSRGPRKEYDQPKRPFGRSADGDATGRPPRKEFDGPRRPFGQSSGGADSRPPRKEFDGPRRPFGQSSGGSDSRPPRKDYDKPSRPFDRQGDGGAESRPRKTYDKPRSTEGSSNAGPQRPFAKSYNKSDSGDKSFRKPADDKGGERSFKPPFKKSEDSFRPRSKAGRPAAESGGGDSRPFRDRPKAGPGKPFSKSNRDSGKRPEDKGKPKHEGPGPKFADLIDKAFVGAHSKKEKMPEDEGVLKPHQHEDKTFAELEDVPSSLPKRVYDKNVKLPADGLKKRDKKEETAPGATEEGDEELEEAPAPMSKRRKRKMEEEEEDELENAAANEKGEMPLNKYIAHCGECSRRDAAEVVKLGKVKVNGELVLEPGYKVQEGDQVTMSGKKLVPQKGMVYILLNKPKGFITTNEDPQGRKTVMDLVGNAGVERLFPVGRLDRDTSGLLLITNDGELTQKLCHPGYNIKKVYQVTLDKPLTKADFEKVIEGVELEDGKAIVDEIAYLEKKNELGLEIHSGRNRIVRRIFESLGYVVEKLDRVMYAGLTKKNLPRSKWRYLDEREIVLLKHFKN